VARHSPRRAGVRKAAEKAGFRSGFEHSVAKSLTARGADFDYEPKDEVIEYEVHELRKYLPDFRINATGIIVECKGRLTAADRKKLKLVKQQYPEKDIRLVFQFNNKLSPRSKTRYSDWAYKNGFQWALKDIPEEWLE
jgi:hypothetical protein